MKRVNITVTGDVQGVFFRSFIRQNALDMGVNGYVRNKGADKVEAVFEGKDKDIGVGDGTLSKARRYYFRRKQKVRKEADDAAVERARTRF